MHVYAKTKSNNKRMTKKKFFITTTVARTLFFFTGQPRLWNERFDVCAIAAEREKLETFAEQEGIRYKYLPMHREISLLSDIACLSRFIWLFLKERPYVVHGNTPKASMLSMLAAWLTGRPVRIYMCHGLRYMTSQGFTLILLKAMEWLTCHCATTVIGVSRSVVEQLVDDGLCPAWKACVIGYGTAGGIDTNKFSREAIDDLPDIRSVFSIPINAFVFSFVGRVVRDKGINELIAAFQRLSEEYANIYLLLVGPQETDLDPISSEAQKVIDNNPRILVFGRKNDVRPYLRASNAFVLPSYREGLGQVLLEANSMDIPCIATDITGCRDVIEDGVNGELVDARSEDELYRKMKDWMNNPKKVQIMSDNSRSLIVSRFNKETVRDEYYKEYCKLARIECV